MVMEDNMPEEKEKILIIDDDESNRKLLSLILKLDGYVLEDAVDGREALLFMLSQNLPLP